VPRAAKASPCRTTRLAERFGLPMYRLHQQLVPARTARSKSVSAADRTPDGGLPPPARSWLMSLLVRPAAPPLWLGVVVAASFIVGETLLVRLLMRIAPGNTYGAVFLFGVLVVSARWRLGLSVMTTLASTLAYMYVHFGGEGSFVPTRLQGWVAILIFLPVAILANIFAGQARLRAADADLRRRQAEANRDELRVLASQQAALRRIATLIARAVPPGEVFSAVAQELAWCLGVQHSALVRYEPDATATVLASRDDGGSNEMPVGIRVSAHDERLAARVLHTGRTARYDNALGLYSGIGTPIVVDGRLWGAAVVGSLSSVPLPADTEKRVGDFADLVATAIANAQTRAELSASRARIVTAADDARRQFERDLHDGAQQRLVSLGLEVRAAEASVPPELHPLKKQIAHILRGLNGVSEDLQEISRGIHPGILSRGGLGPALKTLARRSAVAVRLHLGVNQRLPESVEVAAYYVVAEALTNAAKHAQASEVTVSVHVQDGDLDVTIRDDGIGGANARKGSGLTGLTDRVEALGGAMAISSRPGNGTSLWATIPLEVNAT
jgi:signal transduction histidine kinase